MCLMRKGVLVVPLQGYFSKWSMSRHLDKVSRVTGLPKIGSYQYNSLRITNLRKSSQNRN